MIRTIALLLLLTTTIVGNAQRGIDTVSIHGTFTDDHDGQVYKWVKIGNQIWMADNLNFKLDSKCICYKRLAANCDTYGRLYSWKNAQKACPNGWHLPDDGEWGILIDYLGGESIAGGKMKEAGTLHWKIPNAGATNSSGFNALPGGILTISDVYEGLGLNAYFWTSTMYDLFYSFGRSMYYGGGSVERNSYHIYQLFSIRCIKEK